MSAAGLSKEILCNAQRLAYGDASNVSTVRLHLRVCRNHDHQIFNVGYGVSVKQGSQRRKKSPNQFRVANPANVTDVIDLE